MYKQTTFSGLNGWAWSMDLKRNFFFYAELDYIFRPMTRSADLNLREARNLVLDIRRYPPDNFDCFNLRWQSWLRRMDSILPKVKNLLLVVRACDHDRRPYME